MLAACKKSGNDAPSDPAAFEAYISAYTYGTISSVSAVKVRFTTEMVAADLVGQSLDDKVLSFEPSIKGSLVWEDAFTLSFKPENKLPQGTNYQANLKLGELVKVPDELALFNFGFQTIAQNFDVNIERLVATTVNDATLQKLEGTLLTADAAESAEVEKVLSAAQDNKNLTISWKHENDGRLHRFVVGGIIRSETKSNVKLSWKGSAIGLDKEGEQDVMVPSLSDFIMLSARVVQFPEQYLLVQFSDLLDAGQDLRGLINISEAGDLRYVFSNQEVRVYPQSRVNGTKQILISQGVRSLAGNTLGNNQTLELTFEQVAPAVRFSGKGNILPSSDGLVLPFEAVNLRAVNVTIIKIYEKNIAQFFQVNDIKGNNELRRVGKEVIKSVIPLNASGITDLGTWNRFTLDLNTLITPEPGAIYQVRLSFRKKHSIYGCADSKEISDSDLTTIDSEEEEKEYDSFNSWDSYGDDYYYEDDYSWRERDNPCHSSYYNSSRSINKNILASDLGVIAKKSNAGDLLVFVTNLLTAEPVSGAKVEILNFQQQMIGSEQSNSDGIVKIEQSKDKPFLVIVSQGNQRGYLKLDDGSSQSVSSFDVSGEIIQKGLKGFIYGERGAWRPGDSLHLAFILEDENKSLPANHPVILEIYNPQGQLDKKLVKNQSTKGIYRFSTNTAEDAPTGNWMAYVKVGGTTFSKRLKIEAIKPNRLKINLDFGKERIITGSNNLRGNLDVKWLTGITASNLKAEFEVTLTQGTTSFKGYNGFVFDDPARSFSPETTEIFSGYLNDDGEATINANLGTEVEAPGMLNASFSGKVFEEGGDFSIDQFSIPFYPYSSFVGFKLPELSSYGMLSTDKDQIIDIATVDSEGEGVSRSNLKVEVYKLDWRWWWDQSEDYLSNYVGREYRQPIKSGTVNTVNGKGKYTLRVNEPEWGRFFIRICDPVSGHCSGQVVFMDWPSYAGRQRGQNPDGASILSFASDKISYKTGEKMVLTVPGSGDGRALISIENGSKVISTQWVKTQKGDNRYEVPVIAEMAPNIYVHVTMLQPHSQTVNDLPMRLYGILPLTIDDPETRLSPKLEMPSATAPGKKTKIKISEANGKAMAYTLAIVDEGLLDITRFKTPEPWKSFYAKEALGIKTWDIFDDVIGAYGGKIEHMLTIGGDENNLAPKNLKANRFKPTVQYYGPFYLEKGASKTHEIVINDYVGSVKAMVVAAHESAYGSAEAKMEVKQSLMLLGTLPRVLGPGETVKLPVNVFAMDGTVKDVNIKLGTNPLFTVVGPSNKSISFSKTGDQIVEFELKVAEKTGIGTVNITATSGANTATYDVEMDVRNPNPPSTEVFSAIVEANKTVNLNYALKGIEGTNKATLEISGIPPINLSQRMSYLMGYPHGCIEQTTSAVFPQLYLDKFAELSPEQKDRIQKNITAAIDRLRKFQHPEGGFTYWPGNEQPDSWGSNYAGHFLVEARAKGYFVPDDLINNWKKFQRRMASNWRKNTDYYRDDLIQAYRLYTLALAQSPEMGTMNRLREEANTSVTARWMLASAYATVGQAETAKKIIEGLEKGIAEYKELSYTYGSSTRDEAIIVETLSLLKDHGAALPLVQKISERLSNNNYWMSTQTTAYSLKAIATFVGDNPSSSGNYKFTYQMNNEDEVKANISSPILQRDIAVTAKNGKVSVSNKNETPLFVRVITEGIPVAGQETATESNLKISVIYKNKDGEVIDPSSLAQGTNLVAEVSVHNPGLRGEYKELALTQIIPSGWEILNTRLHDMDQYFAKDLPDYQDIRDDRVLTYFSLQANQRKTFKILLNATYGGKFYLPSINCEAMYDNTINARTAGQWVEVLR